MVLRKIVERVDLYDYSDGCQDYHVTWGSFILLFWPHKSVDTQQ